MSTEFNFDEAFVSVDSQEQGAEFEVVNDAGEKTGFFIRLAGPDSKRRKKTQAKLTDFYMKSGIGVAPANRKERRAQAAEDRYNGDAAIALHDLRMDDLVAATISWRYPKDKTGPDCTPENVRKLYSVHPTLFAQVSEKADDLDLFTKG